MSSFPEHDEDACELCEIQRYHLALSILNGLCTNLKQEVGAAPATKSSDFCFSLCCVVSFCSNPHLENNTTTRPKKGRREGERKGSERETVAETLLLHV